MRKLQLLLAFVATTALAACGEPTNSNPPVTTPAADGSQAYLEANGFTMVGNIYPLARGEAICSANEANYCNYFEAVDSKGISVTGSIALQDDGSVTVEIHPVPTEG